MLNIYVSYDKSELVDGKIILIKDYRKGLIVDYCQSGTTLGAVILTDKMELQWVPLENITIIEVHER